MRLALFASVLVVASLAIGVALGLSGGDPAAAPQVARPVDGHATPRKVHLLRVDPGALPSPTPTAASLQTGSASTSALSAPPAALPPPQPAPAPPPQPDTPAEPPSPAGDGGSFDSPGQDADNTFDSEE